MDTGDGPLGILAGNGRLPLEVAEAVRATGRHVHLVGIAGEAEPAIARHPHTWVGMAQIGAMLRAFHTNNCRDVVILGAVRRPDPLKLRPDAGFILNLPLILSLMAGGDDSVLRGVVTFFQRRGFRVLGAHEVAPVLLAAEGVLGDRKPDEKVLQDAAIGFALIEALGSADVGQAVIVANGRPVVIEAAEGTDAMLARLAQLRSQGLGGSGGVLVKAPKPGQELRVDLPAVGPRTIQAAAAAGLDGIAVRAGQVLVAERGEVRRLLGETGLFLFGAGTEFATAPRLGEEGRQRRSLATHSGYAGKRDGDDAILACDVMAAAEPFGGAGASVVVAREYVLAVEAGEGVLAMIERAARLRQWGDRSSRRRRGVLGLRPEMQAPDQLMQLAADAGLAGIVLARGWRDGVAKNAIMEAAGRHGLFVMADSPIDNRREGEPVRIFLVAGEHSGDAIGARLMAALRARLGDGVCFSGVGGELMEAEGLRSLFPLSDVAVMGPLSILRRLPRIVRRVHRTIDTAAAERPDSVVIIDSPEFTHPIARRIRRRCPDIPIINYVSPTVWAWRPGRARRMRGYVDHVLALFPFEPEVHRKLGGPPCTYVGHPLIERHAWLEALDPEPLANRLGIAPDELVLLVLPGSRSSEVGRLMQPFGGAVRRLRERGLSPRVIIPAVPHVRDQIEAALAEWPLRPDLIEGEEDKFRAFKLATAALAASGTVTLELALAGTPAVVAYKVDAIAARLRFLVKVPSIVLANLVLAENAYPEFVQEDCTPDKLAEALAPLLLQTPDRRRQLDTLARVPERLTVTAASPSEQAAEIVFSYARERRGAVASTR